MVDLIFFYENLDSLLFDDHLQDEEIVDKLKYFSRPLESIYLCQYIKFLTVSLKFFKTSSTIGDENKIYIQVLLEQVSHLTDLFLKHKHLIADKHLFSLINELFSHQKRFSLLIEVTDKSKYNITDHKFMFPPSHGDKFQYNLIDVKGNWGYNNEKYIKTDLITRQSLVNIMRDRITFLINQYQILDLQKKEQLKLDFPQECAPIQKLIEIGNEINLKEQVLKKTETKLNVQEQDLKKTEDLLNLKGQKLALKGQNLNDLISKQEKIIKEMEKDLELKEKEKKNLNISGIYKVIKDNPMKTVLIGGAVIITGVACYYMYIERDNILRLTNNK
jgi:hypothetical protein